MGTVRGLRFGPFRARLGAHCWGAMMKRLFPILLIAIFAVYFFEEQTGRNLGVGYTLGKSAGFVDGVLGTSIAGGFAGGYGAATGVGARVSGGAQGMSGAVSGSMGSVFNK